MNMRVPPSSSTQYQSSGTGDRSLPKDTPTGNSLDPASADNSKMSDLLNQNMFNNIVTDTNKKTNKFNQLIKKNAAKQKEEKADADQ